MVFIITYSLILVYISYHNHPSIDIGLHVNLKDEAYKTFKVNFCFSIILTQHDPNTKIILPIPHN